ncbi:hypothetical protein CHRY9390_03081 [Chryseobacterium aquaeductus]|uniref:Uncharacterized protein n=1 Tax=Chryseobacterium aquaeductus TaxID=2675056 RepID=A0A9N8MIG4_9FLAO|nr:hypothetical protein CHRY9390_03081 [Chryseobacterium potabilaquae]CAD7816003.1 hypothetical protein CHRY9390_03081 [Chryseobacterium aquaeductus]
MKTVFYYLIRKPTFISVINLLYFSYILFLIVYKLFYPPKIGSAYNMIIEMLLICSIVPLGLYIIDRLLVIKINNIKLTIIEVIVSATILLYYFMFVNPF